MKSDTILSNQETIFYILRNVENHKSYYSGGSLCIDTDDGLVTFNLHAYACNFVTGRLVELNVQNHAYLFIIYEKHKGRTDYFKKHFKNYLQKELG